MTIEELNTYLKLERIAKDLRNYRILQCLSTISPATEAVQGDFTRFSPAEWLVLLQTQPNMAEHCSCWNEFTPDDWRKLLRVQPALIEHCPIPDNPTVRSGLLASKTVEPSEITTADFSLVDSFWAVKYNAFALEFCSNQQDFTHEMWVSILIDSPILITFCPFCSEFSLQEWQLLVAETPQLLTIAAGYLCWGRDYQPSSRDINWTRQLLQVDSFWEEKKKMQQQLRHDPSPLSHS